MFSNILGSTIHNFKLETIQIPSIVKWIDKLDIPPVGCYKAVRINLLQSCTTIRTNLRNAILKRKECTVLYLALFTQYYVCETPFV